MFIGCADWMEFQSILGLSLPDPERIVFAALEPTEHRPGIGINALWRDGAGYRWLCTNHFPEDEGAHEWLVGYVDGTLVDQETLHGQLLRWTLGDRMARENLDHVNITDPRIIEQMTVVLDEFNAELRKSGIRVVYGVMARGGEYEDSWSDIQAVYDDLEVAISHAKAAQKQADALKLEYNNKRTAGKGSEDAEDAEPYEPYEYARYTVTALQHRTSLPAHLRDL